MSEQNREPLSDHELSALLQKWAVAAPPELERRVMNAQGGRLSPETRRTWWQFLFKGYIRVPVPVACCLAVVMIVMVWRSAKTPVCLAAGAAMQTVEAMASKVVPVRAMQSAGSCPADSKC